MDFDIPRYPVNYYRSINNFFIQYQYPIALYRFLPFEQERFLKGNYMNYIYYSPFSSLISKDYFRYLFDLPGQLPDTGLLSVPYKEHQIVTTGYGSVVVTEERVKTM